MKKKLWIKKSDLESYLYTKSYTLLQYSDEQAKNLEGEIARRKSKEMADAIWKKMVWRERITGFGMALGFFLYLCFR